MLLDMLLSVFPTHFEGPQLARNESDTSNTADLTEFKGKMFGETSNISRFDFNLIYSFLCDFSKVSSELWTEIK